jgi:hypothetical protein
MSQPLHARLPIHVTQFSLKKEAASTFEILAACLAPARYKTSNSGSLCCQAGSNSSAAEGRSVAELAGARHSAGY